MTPLQNFMAAAGFSVKHGDSQTEVSVVSDNAKGLVKVRNSSTVVTPSTPAQNLSPWQPSESFASETEPESDSSSSEFFYEQESADSPRPPAPGSTIVLQIVADEHPRPPQEEPDQEERNDKMSSVVVNDKENNAAGHQEEGEHIPPRPLLVKQLSQVLAYPVTL
jgi:hypothetical protein